MKVTLTKEETIKILEKHINTLRIWDKKRQQYTLVSKKKFTLLTDYSICDCLEFENNY